MIDQILCNSGNRTQGLCNTITGSNNLVSGDVLYSTYGYLLTAWAGYLFLATYAAAAVILLAFGVWRRQPWTLATVFLGAAIDAIGWGGRVWARSGVVWDQNEGGSYQYDFSSFLMQIICLVIGPVFYSAANYILLGKLVQLTGARYCSLTPKSFSILFCTYDFICLVVQAAGGAMAGIADTTAGANQGAYVMSAGVIIQLVVTLAFVLLLTEYTWRYSKDRPVQRQFHPLPNWRFLAPPQDHQRSQLAYVELNSPTPVHHRSDIEMRGRGKREADPATGGRAEPSLGSRGVWILIGLLIVGTGLVIGRSIFRSIELLGGWAGRIAEDEPLFLVLDALLMVLFAWIWVFVFPGFILPPRAR